MFLQLNLCDDTVNHVPTTAAICNCSSKAGFISHFLIISSVCNKNLVTETQVSIFLYFSDIFLITSNSFERTK